MIEIHNFCHQYGCIKFQIQMSEQKSIPELYTYNHQIDLNMSGASGNWCTLERVQLDCLSRTRFPCTSVKLYLGQESVS